MFELYEKVPNLYYFKDNPITRDSGENASWKK